MHWKIEQLSIQRFFQIAAMKFFPIPTERFIAICIPSASQDREPSWGLKSLYHAVFAIFFVKYLPMYMAH